MAQISQQILGHQIVRNDNRQVKSTLLLKQKKRKIYASYLYNYTYI